MYVNPINLAFCIDKHKPNVVFLAEYLSIVRTEYTKDGSHTRLQTFQSCHPRDFYAWPLTGKDLF